MGSKVAKFLIPAAASFLSPAVGGALGLSGLTGALAGGAITGGAASALTGGNPLTGALTGGVGGAIGNQLGGLLGNSTSDGSGSFDNVISNNASNAGNYTGTSSGLSNLTSGLGLSTGGGSSAYGSSGNSGGIFSNLLGSDSSGGSMGNNFKLGDLLGGINSYSAQDEIAKQQKQGLAQAQSYLQPYYNSGTAANSQLSALLGTGGDSAAAMAALQNDPGYQFRLQQGQQGIDRNLAAQGLSGSGAAVKAASDYSQGQAQQEYQNAIQNLMSQSGQGAQAGQALGNYANTIGQVGAAQTGQQSNIINQGLAGVFGTGQDSTSQLLTRLMRSSYGV